MRRFSIVAPVLGYLAAVNLRVTPELARAGDALSVERMIAAERLRRAHDGHWELLIPRTRPR